MTFACSRRPLARDARDGGGSDEKARIERLYLSPYVEEPLNSKVIKSFVPELRSRKCFSCFQIPMFYVSIYMNIRCTFPIFMYGYGTPIQIVILLHGI